MMTRGFGMGFFGRHPFDKDISRNFQEKWSKMTDSEKLEFMNRRIDNRHIGEDRFSVQHIDAHCEEWMKKTPEEKEEFVNGLKEAFRKRAACMSGFHGHPGIDFGFFEHGTSKVQDQ